jgi:hypothetical protein
MALRGVANVRFWHKADMLVVFVNVCFRRQSGHWQIDRAPAHQHLAGIE